MACGEGNFMMEAVVKQSCSPHRGWKVKARQEERKEGTRVQYPSRKDMTAMACPSNEVLKFPLPLKWCHQLQHMRSGGI
jgi:hypothetical protein